MVVIVSYRGQAHNSKFMQEWVKSFLPIDTKTSILWLTRARNVTPDILIVDDLSHLKKPSDTTASLPVSKQPFVVFMQEHLQPFGVLDRWFSKEDPKNYWSIDAWIDIQNNPFCQPPSVWSDASTHLCVPPFLRKQLSNEPTVSSWTPALPTWWSEDEKKDIDPLWQSWSFVSDKYHPLVPSEVRENMSSWSTFVENYQYEYTTNLAEKWKSRHQK